MKKCLLITCLGCLFCTVGLAQSPWKFRSTEYGGVLKGQDGNYGLLQTVNGLYKKSWFLGIGVGLDYYRFRTIPLFLSVTKDLMPARNGLFLSLDGGINFPDYNRPPNWYYDGYNTSKFREDIYYSAGVGYKIKFSAWHKRHGISLVTGYTFKKLREDFGSDGGGEKLVYSNRELFLKAGLTL